MNYQNNGFTLLEIAISFFILSIISLGIAASFQTTLAGVPLNEDLKTANMLAQRVMETELNKAFANVTNITNTTFEAPYNNFNYNLTVDSLNTTDLKSVRVRVNRINATDNPYAELFNYVFAPKNSILEDFEDRNISDNKPFTWISFPSGQWQILNFPINNYCYEFVHNSQQGTSYPTSSSWSSHLIPNNYSVEYKLWINHTGSTSSTLSRVFLGGRCDTSGNGYYVRIEANNSLTYVGLLKRVNGNYDPAFIGSNLTFSNLLNQWLYVKLEFKGNEVSYYFGNTYPPTHRFTTNDSTFSSGAIFIYAQNDLSTRTMRFDDIKIEY